MGFFRALGLFGQAVRLLRRDRELRRWSSLAVTVCGVCFVGLGVGLFYGVPALLAQWWHKPDTAVTLVLWDAAVVVVYFALFVVGAQTLPVIVLSPVMERLSIATERAVGVKEGQGGVMRFVAETWRAVLKAILRVSILVVGHSALLVLWLFPGFGQAAWTVCSALWSMVWLSFEYVDVTANRHGLRFSQVLALLRRHPGGAFAIGLGIYVLLWIPIVNVFFVPVAVVTAALFFRSIS